MSAVVARIVDVYVFRRTASGTEFLLLRRRTSSFLGNTWQSVHGKIEPGETAWQAAARELSEETGLSPVGFWQLEFVNTFYEATTDEVMMCPCFAAEVSHDAKVVLCKEHTAFRWEPHELARDAFLWPGQRAALHEVMTVIVVGGPAEPYLRLPPRKPSAPLSD